MIQKRSNFGPWPFYREALSIVIPVMLQALITSLVSLIDNFMVAGLGDVKMAAVNVANQINFVYFIMVNTACMAGGVYLSQHRGAENAAGMKQAFRFKLLVVMAMTVAHLTLCLAAPEFLIGLMVSGNAAADGIKAEGAVYLRAVSASYLPMALSMAIGSSYRDIGQTKSTLVFASAATLVNTLLNWVLIYGNLGAPRLEVAGAAIATDLARMVELAAFVAWTAFKKPSFAFRPRRLFAVDRGLFRTILGKSGLMLISETAWVISETIVTAIYNSRGGAETVAGMAAGWTLANIFFLIFSGVQTGTGVIVGSTLGAGKLEEARNKAVWIRSGALVIGCMVAVLAALSIFVIPIVFGNLSAAARLVTRGLVLAIAFYLPLWTLIGSQFAVARAGGDMKMGILVDVGLTYLLFVPAAFAIAKWTSLGPAALFALAKLSDFIKAAGAAWWLRKEHWLKNLAV